MQTNIQRQITLLEHIPREPFRITANELTDKLLERGYEVGLRTVQRELKSMHDMGLFGMVMDDRCKPFGWSIAKCWRGLNLTLMDHHMALAFYTLKHSANQLMPASTLKQLTPYFERADEVLSKDANKPWLYWACRVAQLPQPLPISYRTPDSKALETVQKALLENRQIACQIQRVIKGQRYWIDYRPINLEGIKIEDGVVMLAFTLGREHPRRYAKPLNQMRNIELLDTKAITRNDFDINRVGNAPASASIVLELVCDPAANFIMRDAKFSDDQTIERLTDGRYLVKATVMDSARLREYLWGMADSVEVIAPLKLRAHFMRLASKITNKYQIAATESVA